jgi:hypothetical protein
MAQQGMDKLYDTFAPKERLTLFLQAMARRDEAEALRLWGSCPRRRYEQADAAFVDRHQVAFDTAAVAAADLRHLCGRAQAIRWARELVEALTAYQGMMADLAFEEGIALAEGRPPSPLFLPDEQRTVAPERSVIPEPTEGKRRRRDAYSIEELAQRALAVEQRAREQGERAVAILAGTERAAAGELALAWAAFGRFCRERAGVEPETLLSAWKLPGADEVPALLASYPHDAPAPAAVDEYFQCLATLWEARVGHLDEEGRHGR